MNERMTALIETLRNLDTSDRLLVLEFLFKTYPHQWDFATMPHSLRRFYDPSSKRPQDPTPPARD